MIDNQRMDELCACHSGRKYKNCCFKKGSKPRFSNICLSLANNSVIGVQVEINSETGIILYDENKNKLSFESIENIGFYEGENKRKILLQMPCLDMKYIFDPNLAILQFDIIYCIDTNKDIINNEYVCVTAFSRCEKTGENLAEGFTTSLDPWIVKPDEKQENIAWAMLLDNIPRCDRKYDSSKKIGIIVDSDLGNIPDYNKRIKPIYKDIYLPENVKLIYARSDASGEWLPNKLIKACDKHATDILKDLKKT